MAGQLLGLRRHTQDVRTGGGLQGAGAAAPSLPLTGPEPPTGAPRPGAWGQQHAHGSPVSHKPQRTLGHFGPSYVSSSLGLSLPLFQKKGVNRGSLWGGFGHSPRPLMSHAGTRTTGIVPYPVGQWVQGGLLGVAGAQGGQVGRREPVSPVPSPGLPDRAALPSLSPKFPVESIRLGRKRPCGQRAWPG